MDSVQQRSRIWREALALVFLLASTGLPAQTQPKLKVLHTFHGGDGATPVGVLIRDAAGNIFSTTSEGGSGNCGGLGCGTAFEMNRSGKLLWTHSFKVTNGEAPAAGLLRDTSGHMFGTTLYGGNTKCNPPYGCGTVFKLDKTGKKETALHKFTGTPDGYFPESLLARDKAGNLYLTTYIGGNLGLGGVFKIETTGKEKRLYSFTGGADGCAPYTGVILDSAGNLYGVTSRGGAGFCNSGYGVVFKVDTAGNETVLHTFGGSDGANPASVLLFDSKGNLYGTTASGGTSDVCDGGCGTVYELSPQSGGGWSETVLYSFCSLSGCADGESPGVGPLVRDSAGNLYGTTTFGGTSRNCNGGNCGVVFKLDTTGKETVLHDFTGGADGAVPFAGVLMNAAGDLYGTASGGGDLNCEPKFGGCGVVFKLTPVTTWHE